MTTIRIKTDFPRDSIRVENKQYLPHQFFKNMTLEFLQLLFQDRNEDDYKWDPDNTKTKILIVDKNTYNLDVVEMRPALIVNRGPVSWTNSSGIGNMLATDFRTGKKTFTDLVSGSVTINTLSRNGVEAENLAFNVFWCFKTFKTALRKLGFFKVDSIQMGQEITVVADSKVDLVTVPITVSMLLQDKWIIEPSDATQLTKLIFEHLTIR